MSAAASITLLSDSTDQYVDNYVMEHLHQQTHAGHSRQTFFSNLFVLLQMNSSHF